MIFASGMLFYVSPDCEKDRGSVTSTIIHRNKFYVCLFKIVSKTRSSIDLSIFF